jgi:iron complex outermembrane recepter protein
MPGKRPGGRWTALAAALLPLAGLAQRVDENAVTAADDAFGTTVGAQVIGLYDSEHVRGFNPRAAGNIRIEGLYFDQQTFVTNGCVVVEQNVKVGLAAQSFDNPSPTGVVNFTLHPAGPRNAGSVLLSRGPFLMTSIQLDGQHELPGHAAAAGLCLHKFLNYDIDFAHRSHSEEMSVVLTGTPRAGLEATAFWGLVQGNEHYMLPFVYADPAGDFAIPGLDLQRLPAQRWTRYSWRELTAGAMLRTTGGGPWSLEAGLFESQERDGVGYNDLLFDLHPDRTATHVLDVAPPLRVDSLSGEIRLAHVTTGRGHLRQWLFTLRGRNFSRNFGGDAVPETPYLGFNSPRVSIDSYGPVPEPALLFHPELASEDRVRQLALGVAFEERWAGRGSFAIGVQRMAYRRSIEPQLATPGAAAITDHATPLLTNFRFTADASRRLLFYGSYTRGLEDSAMAPENATNHGESPPATSTWQVDAGARFAPRPTVQLLLGAFEIRKGYYNLDAQRHYGLLGQNRHRGLEASATVNGGQGLTAVLGAVWLRPTVLLTGGGALTPVGPVPLLLDVNLDYAPPTWGPWALALEWRRVSSRQWAPTSGELPPYAVLSLTGRFKFTLLGHACIARLDALDLNDATDPQLMATGAITPEKGRRFGLTLASDF